MSNQYKMNQFAPSYFQGLALDPDAVTEPKPYDYVVPLPNNQLTANQVLNGNTVAIQTDADFYLTGLYLAQYTAPFQYRITDATGYQLSSGFINSGALSQASNDPTVISPAHRFPAGSKAIFDLQDLSGATNPFQLIMKGIKLYRISGRAKIIEHVERSIRRGFWKSPK